MSLSKMSPEGSFSKSAPETCRGFEWPNFWLWVGATVFIEDISLNTVWRWDSLFSICLEWGCVRKSSGGLMFQLPIDARSVFLSTVVFISFKDLGIWFWRWLFIASLWWMVYWFTRTEVVCSIFPPRKVGMTESVENVLFRLFFLEYSTWACIPLSTVWMNLIWLPRHKHCVLY